MRTPLSIVFILALIFFRGLWEVNFFAALFLAGIVTYTFKLFMDNTNSFKGDPNDFDDNQSRYNPFSTSHMNKTNYTKTKSDTYRENVLRLLAVTMNANGKQMVCEQQRTARSSTRHTTSLAREEV